MTVTSFYLKRLEASLQHKLPMTLYHGSSAKFDELKPNEHGIIWLTDDAEAAKKYARKYAKRETERILTVHITKSNPKVVDMRNVSDPLVAEYKRQLEMDMGMGINYKIPDNKWADKAGYFLLEKYGIDLLKEHNVDIIIIKDAAGAYDHMSYAVLNPNIVKVVNQ
jgi:hypothetical protein